MVDGKEGRPRGGRPAVQGLRSGVRVGYRQWGVLQSPENGGGLLQPKKTGPHSDGRIRGLGGSLQQKGYPVTGGLAELPAHTERPPEGDDEEEKEGYGSGAKIDWTDGSHAG